MLICSCTPDSQIANDTITKLLQRLGVAAVDYNKCRQIVLVQTLHGSATQGNAQLLDKNQDHWDIVYEFPVVVGRNGLKWGQGLHSVDSNNIKKEGDGSGPLGVFLIGDAFGDQTMSSSLRWPYKVVTSTDIFVDDALSPYYNQWVDTADVKDVVWKSHEVMLRPDGLYRRGLILRHNMDPVKPYLGSAIFFHIWKSSTKPTAGCTATSKEHIDHVLTWLDPKKKPLWIQLTKD